jgi:phospholipase/carboxylesterase
MKSIVVEPKGVQPLASVIFLHGLGANGHDFEPVARQLMPVLPLRWILPNAEPIPVTINGGMEMPAWYDLTDLSKSDGADFLSAGHSRDYAHELIALEHRRDENLPIVLGGFSQGGAIALFSGFDSPVPLKGLIALSSYLLAREGESGLPADFDGAKAPPVFMGHGEWDDVVPPELAEASHATLVAAGVNVEWHTYPMPHSVCPQQLQDMVFWLMRVLGIRMQGAE